MKKKLYLLALSFTICLTSLFSQEKPEWKPSNLVDFIDLIQYKPQNRFEGVPLDKLKSTILILRPDMMKQMNISAWYNDTHMHEECFRLWNLSYPNNKTNKEMYEKYTYGFIMLLIVDGFLDAK